MVGESKGQNDCAAFPVGVATSLIVTVTAKRVELSHVPSLSAA